MAIDEIFQCSVLASCGRCCGANSPLCEACEIATLKANGLPETYASDISGLSKYSHGHSGFQYSELYHKLNELGQKHYAKNKKG